MEHTELKEMIESGVSLRKISEQTGKSLTTIRYWAKKNNLSSNFKSFKDQETIPYGEFRFCSYCKKDCPITDFYQRRGRMHSSTYCKYCTNKQTLIRVNEFKLKCVEYKGGKCVICGYDRYQGALDFHHLDRNEKDFSISSLKMYSFNDIVREELDKCVILCATCHREVEGGIEKVPN